MLIYLKIFLFYHWLFQFLLLIDIYFNLSNDNNKGNSTTTNTKKRKINHNKSNSMRGNINDKRIYTQNNDNNKSHANLNNLNRMPHMPYPIKEVVNRLTKGETVTAEDYKHITEEYLK